jgi:hypothetical protein
VFGSTPGTLLIGYGLLLVVLSVIVSIKCKHLFEIDPREDGSQ